MVLMARCNVHSSVMRRPSVHEKDAMSAKDARDEALHVLEMMAAVKDDDDDDAKDEVVAINSEEVTYMAYIVCHSCALHTLGQWPSDMLNRSQKPENSLV